NMTVSAPARRVLSLRVFDWDDDGQEDVLVGCDEGIFDGGNLLLKVVNHANGFELQDATSASGYELQMLAMGIANVDANDDGIQDVLISNFGHIALLDRSQHPAVDRGREWASAAYGVPIVGAEPTYSMFDSTDPDQAALGRFQAQFLDTSSTTFPTTKW